MRGELDRVLLAVVVALVALGTVMAYSTGLGMGLGSTLFKKHLAKAALGGIGMLIAYKLGCRRISSWAKGLLIPMDILLLGLLAIKAIHGGTVRWYKLGPFSLQPSEVAKLVLVLYVADFMARKGEGLRDLRRGVLPIVVVCGVSLALISLEPDLGTTVALGTILGGMLFVGGVRLKHILVMVSAAFVTLIVVVFVFGYGKTRVLPLLGKDDEEARRARYQMEQSLVALGGGGVLGRGLGKGIQKHWFLPEPHTDFVFSVVGEELGFLGTLGILGAFVLYGLRGINIARRADETRTFFVAVGLTLMVEVYALLNIAVATGVLPTTGLPLPFVSYGGTSLVVNLVGSGMLLDASRRMG
ncbi:MAG TPA: stage V sporulation protein E [Candidatus Latescibacteria bacterium]|nr:stage V sporulation protein E [Candidatus Latescibacterota bacterium]